MPRGRNSPRFGSYLTGCRDEGSGGKGTRLLPYAAALPKPLVPLGDVPVLELILRQLQGYGFRHVCLPSIISTI